MIQAVTKILQPLVGIKFEFVNSYGDIRIGFNTGEGAYSNLGTDCSIQEGKTMNLGWLDVATILHEFLHALGCIHEHQNPEGGIKWNKCKVYEWARRTQDWEPIQTCPNIIQKYSKDQLNASSYDPDSIMLYYFPSVLTEDNTEVKKNLVLSDTDIEWLSRIYPGGTGLTDDHRRIRPSEKITKKVPNDVNKRDNGDQNGEGDNEGDKEGLKKKDKKGMNPIVILLIVIALIIILMIIYAIFFDEDNKNSNIPTVTTTGLISSNFFNI